MTAGDGSRECGRQIECPLFFIETPSAWVVSVIVESDTVGSGVSISARPVVEKFSARQFPNFLFGLSPPTSTSSRASVLFSFQA